MKAKQIKEFKKALFKYTENYSDYNMRLFLKGARQLRHAMIMSDIIEMDSIEAIEIDRIIEVEFNHTIKK